MTCVSPVNIVGYATVKFSVRSVFEEFRCGKPRQEHVWVHIKPEETWTFQPMFLGK